MFGKKCFGSAILTLTALIGFAFLSCDSSGNGGISGGNNIDYTKFEVVNNGNGAVSSIIPDPYDQSVPLEIIQTIPSFTSSSGYLPVVKKPVRPAANTPRYSYNISMGTFPADLPIMFFFNDKIYLHSIKDNVVVAADGKDVKGTITISESARGYAILTFVPWQEFNVNKTIAVTIKKGLQNSHGKGLVKEVNLIYQTSLGASGSFDGNGGFESGMNGVMFVGDGGRVQATGSLLPKEGQWFAAISTGSYHFSESKAVGNATSMIILGPINKEITSLTFFYDFISAEFNEYINAGYDDTVMFTISGPKGSYTELITSVDTVGHDNFPFEGYPRMPNDGDNNAGDDYAGHTGWTKRTINFNSVGTPAHVTFTVTDVGDHILTSILAVDNITY